MEQGKPFTVLGHTRLRIVSCLGGDVPSLPQYLKLGSGEDVFAAFRGFVERMSQICAADREWSTRALIGAGRLLVGEVAGGDEILDHLPPAPVMLDHGAGYCRVVPVRALQASLPLPAPLRQARSVLAGSREQAALRGWLDRHRRRLVWEEARGEYRIAGADSGDELSS